MSIGARMIPRLVSCCAAALTCALTATAEADTPQEIAAKVCIACHGEDGNSIVPIFPKIAGQQTEYITKQLQDFVDGKRNNDLMSPVAANLSKSDIKALATHYNSQPPAPGQVADPQLAESGMQIYMKGNPATGVPGCTGCHKPDGTGNPRNPRIAGQHTAYIIAQLKAFADGSRSNDKGKLMRTIAGRLSDDEMKAVAEYITGLASPN